MILYIFRHWTLEYWTRLILIPTRSESLELSEPFPAKNARHGGLLQVRPMVGIEKPMVTDWDSPFQEPPMMDNNMMKFLIIELADGKIETRNHIQFDGKNHGFRFQFSRKAFHH